jgi:hypothetical protein
MRVFRDDDPNNERCKLLHDILINIYTEITYKIHTIIDHKGCITVYWDKEPCEYDKNCIKKIWEVLGEYDIDHVLIKFERL